MMPQNHPISYDALFADLIESMDGEQARVFEKFENEAEFGLSVFPGHSIDKAGRCTCGRATCGSPGKHPRIKSWQVKASPDPETIRQWWTRWPSANVCIATGSVSGVVVLDVDPRHGGDESVKVLQDSHPAFSETPVSRTGGGGLHFFFQHPGRRVPNKVGLLPGIDIRGDGGFVIAPPSLHVSGEVYKWVRQLVLR